MKSFQIIMDGRKKGTVKTDDIHDYAKKIYPQGYEVKGNKLIVNSITIGQAMAIGMNKSIPGITDGGEQG